MSVVTVGSGPYGLTSGPLVHNYDQSLETRFADYERHYSTGRYEPTQGGLGPTISYGRHQRWGLDEAQVRASREAGTLSDADWDFFLNSRLYDRFANHDYRNAHGEVNVTDRVVPNHQYVDDLGAPFG
jgi:hypothetical protein